jgi:hypothetical protein
VAKPIREFTGVFGVGDDQITEILWVSFADPGDGRHDCRKPTTDCLMDSEPIRVVTGWRGKGVAASKDLGDIVPETEEPHTGG